VPARIRVARQRGNSKTPCMNPGNEFGKGLFVVF